MITVRVIGAARVETVDAGRCVVEDDAGVESRGCGAEAGRGASAGVVTVTPEGPASAPELRRAESAPPRSSGGVRSGMWMTPFFASS